MRCFILCLFAPIAWAVSIELESCHMVDSMKESGENMEEPELYKEYVRECIAELNKVLDVDNWTDYMEAIVEELLENFNGYHIYDEPDQSYHERIHAERQLNSGIWKEKFEDIAFDRDTNEKLIRDVTDYYTSGFGSGLIERSLKKDARTVGEEIEAEKPRLQLKKEEMEFELDPRRRSTRIAEKKRKRVSDLSG